MEKSKKILEAINENIKKVIIGKEEAVKLALIALIANGHVLIEDVPGVGKTSLVAALAKSVDCSFKRIQFTPDILPSDITGFSIFNQKIADFEFRHGAVMSQFVLADEINRTSPKTQAALLEAMEERQLSIDGTTYELPKPFMVLATQNPIEFLGTFPLPEAQMDRFFMKITMGYPNIRDELMILERYNKINPLSELTPVATADDIIEIQNKVKDVFIDASLNNFIVTLVTKTRNHPYLELGASPRASLYLHRAAQANALLKGSNFVVPEDILEVIVPVLSHRIVVKHEFASNENIHENIIKDILNEMSVPVLNR